MFILVEDYKVEYKNPEIVLRPLSTICLCNEFDSRDFSLHSIVPASSGKEVYMVLNRKQDGVAVDQLDKPQLNSVILSYPVSRFAGETVCELTCFLCDGTNCEFITHFQHCWTNKQLLLDYPAMN